METIKLFFLAFICTALVGFTLLYTHKPRVVVIEKPAIQLKTPELPPPPPPYDPSTLTWSVATSSAEWQPRDSAASFVFQNKIWTMGGLNGNKEVSPNHTVEYWESPHFNDIWSSEDGTTWKLESPHAQWAVRRSMSVVFFQDKLWMFGGWSPITGYTSDIWQSVDGVNWSKVVTKASWQPREGQTAEVFQNKIWMMGGVNYDARKLKNDVWYSEDGLTWHEATSTIPWSPRWDHAVTVFDNKLFLSGGMNLTKETFKDVWSSSDGITWELITDSPPWQERQGHGLVAFHDNLWSIGRLNDTESGGMNDVWYSKDGATWNKTAQDPLWMGREDHSVILFKNKIFVFGGMGSDWKWRNDVWISSE